jgi:hypothetical protein
MQLSVKVISGLEPVSPPDYLEWFDLSSRPLLELALKDATPARSVKVEWLIDRMKDGAVEHRVWHNYTQILRRPIRPKWLPEKTRLETFTEATRRAGNEILDDAELTLWYGKPRRYISAGHLLTMCGGVYHYLRRRVYENDTVQLRDLSGLTLRDFRTFDDVGATGEWLWEFSLQVIPGHYQRGMKPLFLPPVPQSVKGWAQGASLEEEST